MIGITTCKLMSGKEAKALAIYNKERELIGFMDTCKRKIEEYDKFKARVICEYEAEKEKT